MPQKIKETIENKAFLIPSIVFLSLIFSLFIHSTWAAIWTGPTAPPPDGNVGAPLYNEEKSSPNFFAIIDRSYITFTGGVITNNSLRVNALRNCGKIYSDSNGIFQCGADAGSGLIDINSQTTGNLDLSRTTGSLDLSRTTGNLDLSRTTGSLDLSRTTGNLDLSRTTGSLDLGSRTTGNLDLSRTTGSLDLGSRTTGNLDLSRTTGVIDINSRTTGTLPAARVSGLPSLSCKTIQSTSNWYNGAGDGRFWSHVDCEIGWIMTGGGCLVNDYCWTKLLAQSYPTENGWTCAQQTSGCDNLGPTSYVRCCRY